MALQNRIDARVVGERVVIGDRLVGLAGLGFGGGELEARQHAIALGPGLRQAGQDLARLGGVGALFQARPE